MLFKRIAILSLLGAASACTTMAPAPSANAEPKKADTAKVAAPTQRVKHNKDAEIEWIDPEASVLAAPGYAQAKEDVLEFWQCFSEKDWENCYLLETPGLRKDMKLPFYLGLWGNTARLKTIKLANMQFVSDSKLAIDVTYVFAPKPGGLAPDLPSLTLRQEWLKVEEDGGKWRRDYHDPVFRPAPRPAS